MGPGKFVFGEQSSVVGHHLHESELRSSLRRGQSEAKIARNPAWIVEKGLIYKGLSAAWEGRRAIGRNPRR